MRRRGELSGSRGDHVQNGFRMSQGGDSSAYEAGRLIVKREHGLGEWPYG
jgi:hypothetical protein